VLVVLLLLVLVLTAGGAAGASLKLGAPAGSAEDEVNEVFTPGAVDAFGRPKTSPGGKLGTHTNTYT